MRRRREPDDHLNHERWVVSYADMVTLLFALFVVLYALGEVKLRKLKDLKQSLAFAFHFEGHGQTFEPGIHDRGEEGGDLYDAEALITNPQKGPMKEFIADSLAAEYEQVSGKSLDVVMHDDTVAFTGPLSGFFVRGSKTLRPDVHDWLTRLVAEAHHEASHIRITIECSRLVLAEWADGSPYFTRDLCLRRLGHLHELVGLMNEVMEGHVDVMFDYNDEYATLETWEDRGTISFAFSNPALRGARDG